MSVVIQILNPKGFLGFRHTFLGKRYCLNFDIYIVVLFRFQTLHETVGCIVQLGRFLGLSGNNQRSTRLIDKNGVHLVNNAEIERTLNHLLFVENHIVTQIVEPEFIVRSVRNIASISRLLLFMFHTVQVDPYGHSQEVIDLAHFRAVTLCQIIIHGHNVNALAKECI
ncbi:hypothetical protein D3C71_710290 [compost metagenome]